MKNRNTETKVTEKYLRLKGLAFMAILLLLAVFISGSVPVSNSEYQDNTDLKDKKLDLLEKLESGKRVTNEEIRSSFGNNSIDLSFEFFPEFDNFPELPELPDLDELRNLPHFSEHFDFSDHEFILPAEEIEKIKETVEKSMEELKKNLDSFRFSEDLTELKEEMRKAQDEVRKEMEKLKERMKEAAIEEKTSGIL